MFSFRIFYCKAMRIAKLTCVIRFHYGSIFFIVFLCLVDWVFGTACTQEEVNKVMEAAKAAQKLWARTPLWKRAEHLHKAAAILKEHRAPIAECLVKEIAKPAKDAVTEVNWRVLFFFFMAAA